MLTLLALGLYSLSRGSYPLPASTLARALLAPQEMGEQPRFILFDIRLPRILMALLCGAMLGLAGAAMQSITRNGLADPGLIGVKEGASIVVLALVLFFPAVGLVWRPLAGMVGGIAVALLVLTLARDCSRPRFILIGIGVSTEPGGRGRHLYDHRRRTRRADGDDLAGGQPAGRHLAAAGGGFLLGAARGHHPVLYRPGGGRGAAGRPDRHRPRRTSAAADGAALFAPVLLTSASVSCVGSLGFVGLMAPHMARFVLRGGQVSLLCGSALIGALLVLATDTLGRLAFAPLQIPAGIVIALVGCPFFVVLLWRRRDAL